MFCDDEVFLLFVEGDYYYGWLINDFIVNIEISNWGLNDIDNDWFNSMLLWGVIF